MKLDLIFDSPSRVAYCQSTRLDIRRQRTTYLQKSRTQIFPPISPNGWRTFARWGNHDPQWCIGIEHEKSRNNHDTITSSSLIFFASFDSWTLFLFFQDTLVLSAGDILDYVAVNAMYIPRPLIHFVHIIYSNTFNPASRAVIHVSQSTKKATKMLLSGFS